MTSATVPSTSATVRVPAKVNLELLVGPRREDGFHALSTVYHAVSLFDEVTVSYADEWGLEVAGPRAEGVPTDGSNLAARAAQLPRPARAGVDEPVHIRIRKDIPVAGGMAGGSADAAAALVACDHLWGLGMTREELEELAAELGSDVPFLLAGGTAMGSGRGEVLAPVLARGTYHWVFALSEGGLSTPAVYAECDRLRGRPGRARARPDPRDDDGAAQRRRRAPSGARSPTTSRRPDLACMPELGDILDGRAASSAPSAASSPAPARPWPSSSTATRRRSTWLSR